MATNLRAPFSIFIENKMAAPAEFEHATSSLLSRQLLLFQLSHRHVYSTPDTYVHVYSIPDTYVHVYSIPDTYVHGGKTEESTYVGYIHKWYISGT